MNPSEKDEILLIQLILMFQTAALQQMGKLKNPLTDKIEQDLDQAHISIDIVEMIQKKTKGNLTEREERMMTDVLRELKLNYVDEVTKAKAAPQASGPEEPKSSS